MSNVKGSIPAIVNNKAMLYEGDLRIYFQILWRKATNLNAGYHNFRHICHVLWLCHEACEYYADRLTPRQMRNLLIAALFHDFDHTGAKGSDDINIARALAAFEAHVLPQDRPYMDEIRTLIKATEYPYKVPSEEVNFLERIIRDADMGQALSVAWIQHVVFGLAREWKVEPLEVVRGQGPFHAGLTFHTEWGQQKFPREAVESKIEEANELFEIITAESAVSV